MEWPDITADLDDYLGDIPEPTDDDLRAIEADPVLILTDDELRELLESLLED